MTFPQNGRNFLDDFDDFRRHEDVQIGRLWGPDRTTFAARSDDFGVQVGRLSEPEIVASTCHDDMASPIPLFPTPTRLSVGLGCCESVGRERVAL